MFLTEGLRQIAVLAVLGGGSLAVCGQGNVRPRPLSRCFVDITRVCVCVRVCARVPHAPPLLCSLAFCPIENLISIVMISSLKRNYSSV